MITNSTRRFWLRNAALVFSTFGRVLRAAVLVLEAVDDLGFVRAAVDRVGEAVAVVVQLGAAVLVLELVDVLRVQGAAVVGVGDAVVVVVEVGTTVLVLPPVGIL